MGWFAVLVGVYVLSTEFLRGCIAFVVTASVLRCGLMDIGCDRESFDICHVVSAIAKQSCRLA